MKRPALLVALLTLASFLAIPVLGQFQKYGSKREPAPKGWTKFAWPEKKAILFGHYAPTKEELALVDQAMPTRPTAAPRKKRRILLFYKCDYPHTSIATGVAAFQKMAEKTKAFEIDATDDPATFSTENLAKYDAILLNNTVAFETFLSEEQRQAYLDFIKSGKGLIGIHAAADACKGWKEGAEVMGGIFRCHPWTSGGTWAMKVESPLHPLNGVWEGKGDHIRDEIYHYREGSFSRKRSRVLLSLDMSQQRNIDGRGLVKNQAHLVKKDGDYPIAWLHEFGQGRVFYSNLGHNSSTYWNPKVLKHYLDGIQYALGDLPADATPSAKLNDVLMAHAPSKKIVFLAGKPSHRSGDHEFRAGSLLLAKALNHQTDLPIQAEVYSGWPKDDSVLNDAAAIVVYCDADSVVSNHYDRMMELSERGTGFFFMHYGVHPKEVQSGKDYYMPTIGGFMETDYSVNPHWAADLTVAGNHPVRRGCEKPIKVHDEWYYHMRFDPKAIPLVTGIPTKDNLVPNNLWNKNGPAGFNKPQTLMWGFEKPDGTRGGGFTGGHYHRNWAIPGFRKVVLNAIVWIAGLDVPQGGVKSKNPTEEELNANLDAKKPMVRIKLPLKGAMEYHQAIVDARNARRKAAEARKEKKKAAKKMPPKKPVATQQLKWRSLLDERLTHWDKWMGVPHKSVKIPGQPAPTSENGTTGEPLGLNNDPLNVFSVIKENNQPVLKITGEVYGGLTTKEEFENYHLQLQFKWGEKKWEPRLKRKRDSGILLHCVGKHGAFWNVWKRCLECQVQEGDVGDFFALAGTMADIRIAKSDKKKRPMYDPKGQLQTISNNAQHSPSTEKPNGQWNTVDIYTVGDKMIHVVNGQLNMVLLNTRQKTVHGPAPLTKGQIQIQSEAAEVYYRDIKIRPIKEFPEAFRDALK